MHQGRRQNRRPARRVGASSPPVSPVVLAGSKVVLVGYFSAKQKDFGALMDQASADLTAREARVVGQLVQRRGVSDGGVRKMLLPFSSRNLLSHGKARELETLCAQTEAEAVVFLAPLTEWQQRVLAAMLGCPVIVHPTPAEKQQA